ncbi:MAG TPA: hypothetical protein VMB49_00360 [Acidobacteriaceae bacterium]|nr:hypothetical protein [Acidobacteriaceae bacterium]
MSRHGNRLAIHCEGFAVRRRLPSNVVPDTFTVSEDEDGSGRTAPPNELNQSSALIAEHGVACAALARMFRKECVRSLLATPATPDGSREEAR